MVRPAKKWEAVNLRYAGILRLPAAAGISSHQVLVRALGAESEPRG